MGHGGPTATPKAKRLIQRFKVDVAQQKGASRCLRLPCHSVVLPPPPLQTPGLAPDGLPGGGRGTVAK